MKKFNYLLFVLLMSNAASACIIDQLVAETNNGVNWPVEGPTWGQSFVACETGPVWEIAFWPNQTTTGLHTFILTDINCNTIWTVPNINIPGTGNQIIVDLSTGSGTSRNVTSGTAYAFQLIGPAGSNIQINLSWNNPYPAGADRTSGCASYGVDWWFRVGINEGLGVLPVELSAFSAKLNVDEKAVELDFETASEINASHFVVEHSIEGIHFQEIGRVKAYGTTSEKQHYYFTDKNPVPGDNYYRLKQVDEDGSFEYSAIVHVLVASGELSFRIWPNPTTGNLYFNTSSDRKLKVQLFSLDGRILKEEFLENNRLPLFSIPSGIYFIKVSENGISVWAEKIVKQ